MDTANVRYIVDDVDAAIAFYTERLDFTTTFHPGPGFAMLARGPLRLLLNTPTVLEEPLRSRRMAAGPSPAAGTESNWRSTTLRSSSRL